MLRIGKWLSVESIPVKPNRKTAIWKIVSNMGDLLGTIRWYGPWRQYTFQPESECVFNRICLIDITDFLDSQNTTHRAKKETT